MSLEYILDSIKMNCKNKNKKRVAIQHLTEKMEKLPPEDKLRVELWIIIKELEKIN